MKIVEKERYFEEKSNSLSFNKKEQMNSDLSIGLQNMAFYELLKAYFNLSKEFNSKRQIFVI